MADWIVWFVIAGGLVALELFLGTFYLLMIAIGLAFGGIAALAGISLALQAIVAAIVGVGATVLLRRSRFGMRTRTAAGRDPNLNIDIGQPIRIDAWVGGSARAMYRGALWDVDLAPGALAEAGNFRIVEVRGSRLVVMNA